MGSNKRALPGHDGNLAARERSTASAGGLRLNLTHLAWLQAVIATGISNFTSGGSCASACIVRHQTPWARRARVRPNLA